MKQLRHIFITLCIAALLSVSAFAGDCHDLSEEWFGSDGSDGSALNLQSLNENEPQLDALLDELFTVREADFINVPVVYGEGEADSLQSIDGNRRALVAALESRINAVITDAQVSSFITNVETTDTGYIATVYEWTFFDYDDLSDGEGGSDTAGFGTEHLVTFAYNNSGELEIVSDAYKESEVLTGELPELSAEEIAAAEAEFYEGDTLNAVTFDADFDPVKASIYANKWVSQENTDELIDSDYYNTDEYNNWNPYGGDCANYVSQCLYAGNFSTNSTWYKDSRAWITCPAQFNCLQYYGTVVQNPTEEDVYPGAPIYFGNKDNASSYYYYHVVICTGHNSAGTPVINGHNYDRYRVPWNYNAENLRALVQLTDYEIEDMTFEADNLIAIENVTIPVYTYYQSSTSGETLQLSKGDTYPVLTGFKLGGVQWAAIDYNKTTVYVKVENDVRLESQAPTVAITTASTVTTNDYLEVTASVSDEPLTSATLELTDAAGTKQSIVMTCSEGVASATVDCQNLAPGTLRVTVAGSSAMWEVLVGSVDVDVVAADKVSVYDGNTLLWELDKTTGALIVYGSGEVTDTSWTRFADKIKTVQTSPDITGLTAEHFSGSDLTTIYGQPEYLAAVAQELGAKYVAMGHFMDMFPNKWYFDEINYVYEHKLFNGMTTYEFGPDHTMNRAMFVTVLARLAGADTDAYTKTPFTDVAEGKYYFGSVAWASELGIVTGVTETEFCPNDDVTREQVITLISRFLRVYEVELEDAEAPAEAFTDMDDAHNYAKEEIDIMRRKGIATGYTDGTFLPRNNLKRAEAAALLQRLCVAMDAIAAKP